MKKKKGEGENDRARDMQKYKRCAVGGGEGIMLQQTLAIKFWRGGH